MVGQSIGKRESDNAAAQIFKDNRSRSKGKSKRKRARMGNQEWERKNNQVGEELLR